MPLGNVLFVTAKDGISDTKKQRLELLGADHSRIFSIGVSVKKGNKDIATAPTKRSRARIQSDAKKFPGARVLP